MKSEMTEIIPDEHCPVCGLRHWYGGAAMVCLTALRQENERRQIRLEALLSALRNQGLLQNTATGVVWHVHDCPASFDFDECNYRCRVAREGFALAGTEPYISQETRRDTEVYE